jgi:hypothetical protein
MLNKYLGFILKKLKKNLIKLTQIIEILIVTN